MQQIDGRWIFSASDLVARMECDHRSRLQFAYRAKILEDSPEPPAGMMDLAVQHGHSHEARVLEQLRLENPGLVDVEVQESHLSDPIAEGRQLTVDAMNSDAPVIHGARFFDGEFTGTADFLIRTDSGYEVYDTKLARSPKPGALLQLAAYSEQVHELGFAMPKQMHVWLGDNTLSTHSVDDVLPKLRHVRRAMRALIAEGPSEPDPIWGEAKTACTRCGWLSLCAKGRDEARDLSLVAGIRGDQRRKLRDVGVSTLEGLAGTRDSDRPRDLAEQTFEKLRAQAVLQAKQDASRSESNRDGTVSYEVFSDEGLQKMPAPCAGDIWFDMEGDPFAERGEGLEYLFGAITIDLGREEFTDFWAHSPEEEKVAFERFVDWVEKRRRMWPSLHIYHYAPYERTALRRLAGQHGTREKEIDDWLIHGLLVDLYAVVRASVRISQRSYSIKKLEALYGLERVEDVTTAGDSVVDYENYLELKALGKVTEAEQKLRGIRDYNEVDCVSTVKLDRWLRERGPARSEPLPGSAGSGTATADSGPSDDGSTPLDHPAVEVQKRLLAQVPDSERTAPQQGAAMVAAAMDYHRREQRPQWWEHFQRLDATTEEWSHDDDVVIVRACEPGPWDEKRVNKYRELQIQHSVENSPLYSEGDRIFLVYDNPPLGMEQGSEDGRGFTEAKVSEHTDGVLRVTKEVWKVAVPHEGHVPVAVLPGPPPRTTIVTNAIFDVAESISLALPEWPLGAVTDLLVRRPPRSTGGSSLPRTGDHIRDVLDAIHQLDSSYLAVQGPPGSGKTYLAAHVIKNLVDSGWRVGVVAQSHKVIENVLETAIEQGLDSNLVGKEVKSGSTESPVWKRQKIDQFLASASGGCLIGGTVWTYSRVSMQEGPPLDLMVIDEAGQFSLANTIALARSAKRFLLLGDPQQLPQVSQGTHPEPVDRAALAWLAEDAPVLPKAFGYFLEQTRRMHPEVCDTVSRLSYDRELTAHETVLERHLESVPPGVRAVPVEHKDRSVHSEEEVEAVAQIVAEHLGLPWHDGKTTRPLHRSEILVVAPYNRQVAAIRVEMQNRGLGEVRVGTVDKFQGQEAPIVIVSMTSSSQEAVPRGMSFLLSRNRLNVAVSRAQWASYVVHSPTLADHSPTSTEELELLGAFLGVLEP